MNTVSIIGRVGQDPTIKYTATGKAVANFSIAVENGYGDQKVASWIPIVAWEKTAELIGKFVARGSQVAVEGRLQQRSWEDKDGNKRSVIEVIANRVDFLTKKVTSSQTEQLFETTQADEELAF